MFYRAWRGRLAAFALAVATLSGCGSMPTSSADLLTAVASNPKLSLLAGYLQQAKLGSVLGGSEPFTLFAPTDDAFKALKPADLAKLVQDPEQLKKVLSYHVVPGKLSAADLKTGTLKSVEGGELPLARSGDFVTLGEALVTQSDIQAKNGVIHVIDRVLVPPPAKK